MKALLILSIVILALYPYNINAQTEARVIIASGASNSENSKFYDPRVLTIEPDTIVRWINVDKSIHNVIDGSKDAKEWGKIFDSGILEEGDMFTYKFTTAGTYDYICSIHPWMYGKIIVNDNSSTSSSSVSISNTITGKLNLFIRNYKQEYFEKEVINLKIEVIGLSNMHIDPDNITASLVNVASNERRELDIIHKDTGIFQVTINELKSGTYNIVVNASKKDFESGTSSLTLYIKSEIVKQEPITLSIKRNEYETGDTVTVYGKVINAPWLSFQLIDPTNKLYTRGQVTSLDGAFKWSTQIPEDGIAGQWKIVATYANETADVSFLVKKRSLNELPRDPVSVSVSLLNSDASILEEAHLNTPVIVQSILTNNLSVEQTFTYIVQVKNSEDVVKLEFIEGMLYTDLKAAISWIPRERGNYTIEIFVWKSIEDPSPLLLNPVRLEISV